MMWRPNDPVEEEVSAPLGIAPQGKHGRSRRRNWRDGLADQTVLQPLDDFRSYRAFERALIGSVAKALMRTDVTMCWSVTRNRCEPPPCRRRSVLLWRQATQT